MVRVADFDYNFSQEDYKLSVRGRWEFALFFMLRILNHIWGSHLRKRLKIPDRPIKIFNGNWFLASYNNPK